MGYGGGGTWTMMPNMMRFGFLQRMVLDCFVAALLARTVLAPFREGDACLLVDGKVVDARIRGHDGEERFHVRL